MSASTASEAGRWRRGGRALEVGGHADLGVAERLHDQAQVGAAVEHEGREGVAQVVDGQPGESGPLPQLPEPPVDVGRLDRRADSGREGQVVRVSICAATRRFLPADEAASVIMLRCRETPRGTWRRSQKPDQRLCPSS